MPTETLKPDGGPAFPIPYNTDMDGYVYAPHASGMTLRDWFAGQIAGGMAAHSGTMGTPFGPGDIAQRSYEVADAMLAARAEGATP